MTLIVKEELLAEYDRVHVGPPGGARKLMEDAPAVEAIPIEWLEERSKLLSREIDIVAKIEAEYLRMLIECWRKENERSDQQTGGD